MDEASSTSPHGPWRVMLRDAVMVFGAEGVEATPRARKARALIAYLALKPEHVASRAEVIALLWSDRGRDQARASLRQCLFEIRAEAPGLFEAGSEQVSLQADTTGAQPAGPLIDLDRIDSAFDAWLALHREARHTGASALPTGPHAKRPRGEGWLLWLIATFLLAAGAASWVAWRGRAAAPKPQLITLTPWLITPADPAGAERISSAIRADLPTERILVRLPDARVAPVRLFADRTAGWIVNGVVVANRRPATLVTQVRTGRGTLLWTGRLEPDPSDLAHAEDRLGNWTASVVLCAVGGPRGARRSDDQTALLMDACGKDYPDTPGYSDEAGIVAARRLIAAAPDDAYAHGLLSAWLALDAEQLPADLAAPAREAARAEAARALALDPRTGEAYLTLGQLALDRHDFAGAESSFLRGLAAEPDHPSLPNYESDLLQKTGRNDEALVFARRALARDPASTIKMGDVATALARAGQPRAALAMLDEAERHGGRDAQLVNKRVAMLLRGGDPAGARVLIEHAAEVPGFLEPWQQAKLLRQTYAIENPHGPQAEAMIRELGGATAAGPTYRVLLLASLGRRDAALDVAMRDQIDTESLFRPGFRTLLLSPRFPDAARKQGLWTYWERTGHWPDICGERGLPWRCGPSVKKPSMAH